MSHKHDPLGYLQDVQRNMEKSLPYAPKLYVLQGVESDCVFCSLSSVFYFVGDKIASGYFKDEITPYLKANYRLEYSQYFV